MPGRRRDGGGRRGGARAGGDAAVHVAPAHRPDGARRVGGRERHAGDAHADGDGKAADVIDDAETAIVGAGVMGLAIAYNLAARGGKRIVVVDGHYMAWGASGRNGGGVRQQWSTEMNVRLMQESMDICAHFAKQMGINVWMRRGGYLFLARTQAAARRLERNVAVQIRCGLGTQMIAPEEAQALVPALAIDRPSRYVAACYNP